MPTSGFVEGVGHDQGEQELQRRYPSSQLRSHVHAMLAFNCIARSRSEAAVGFW